jgi:uncharacterized membrane protein
MMQKKDNNTVIIDVRNAYESAIGHFAPPENGAELIDPEVVQRTASLFVAAILHILQLLGLTTPAQSSLQQQLACNFIFLCAPFDCNASPQLNVSPDAELEGLPTMAQLA